MMNPTDFGPHDPEGAAQHYAQSAKEWAEKARTTDAHWKAAGPPDATYFVRRGLVAAVEALLAVEARLRVIDDRLQKVLNQRHYEEEDSVSPPFEGEPRDP